MTTYEGKLEFHSETGTEGGHWAMQTYDSVHGEDDLIHGKCPWKPGQCPVEDGSWHEHGRYEGLHVLRDGDRLEVFSKDDGTEVWSGTVELIRHKLFTEDAMGMWIHADQAGVQRDEWAAMFFAELPCRLTRDDT